MNLIGEIWYFGICLEGILFGLYSGIFVMHWHCHTSRNATEKSSRERNIIFYAISLQYVLSAVFFGLDIANYAYLYFYRNLTMVYRFNAVSQPVVFACCDFITQAILIRRCWIVWGHNIHIVIIPSILAVSFLVMWITSVGSMYLTPLGDLSQIPWGSDLNITSLTVSMTVNALMTGLIVFRVFKVFHEVKRHATDKSLGITHGSKLRSVIFIVIESGMVLFALQVVRLGLSFPETTTDIEDGVFDILLSIHTMINGITPVIILVRVSMGLSFDDEQSVADAVSSLQFAEGDPSPEAGMGSISQDFASDDPMSIEK